MKKLLCGAYTVVWQCLRVCAALLLCSWGGCVYMAFYESVRRDPPKFERDPYMCGKISGVTYEFLKSYAVFWPEYEGRSSWEAGFTYNKKGCDANFRALDLLVTWPDFQPGSGYFSRWLGHGDLVIGIEPLKTHKSDLNSLKGHYLKKTPAAVLQGDKFSPYFGLNYVEGVDHVLGKDKQAYFWSGAQNRVDYVGYCTWLDREGRYSICKISYLMKGNVLIEVKFTPEKLNLWQDVIEAVNKFIEKNKKYGVGDA